MNQNEKNLLTSNRVLRLETQLRTLTIIETLFMQFFKHPRPYPSCEGKWGIQRNSHLWRNNLKIRYSLYKRFFLFFRRRVSTFYSLLNWKPSAAYLHYKLKIAIHFNLSNSVSDIHISNKNRSVSELLLNRWLAKLIKEKKLKEKKNRSRCRSRGFQLSSPTRRSSGDTLRNRFNKYLI